MLMSGREIEAAAVVQNASSGMYKAASYNIRVGKILLPEGAELESHRIPPLGMVKVISWERLNLPKDVLAYATVKTGLSNDGILAINIGLVDPDYEGLVSSMLINFSKNDYYMEKGDEFLRLTFHRYEPRVEKVPAPSYKMEDAIYLKEAKRKLVEKFAETFLNIKENTKQFLKEELRSSLLRWVPAAAFLVAAATFFLNFGNTAVASWFAQRSIAQQVQTQTAKDIDQLKSQSKEFEKLQSKVADLEQEVQVLKNKLNKGGKKAP